jgi:hypothetical protein
MSTNRIASAAHLTGVRRVGEPDECEAVEEQVNRRRLTLQRHTVCCGLNAHVFSNGGGAVDNRPRAGNAADAAPFG